MGKKRQIEAETLCPHCGEAIVITAVRKTEAQLAEEREEAQLQERLSWQRVEQLIGMVGYTGPRYGVDTPDTLESRVRTWICQQGLRVPEPPP